MCLNKAKTELFVGLRPIHVQVEDGSDGECWRLQHSTCHLEKRSKVLRSQTHSHWHDYVAANSQIIPYTKSYNLCFSEIISTFNLYPVNHVTCKEQHSQHNQSYCNLAISYPWLVCTCKMQWDRFVHPNAFATYTYLIRLVFISYSRPVLYHYVYRFNL